MSRPSAPGPAAVPAPEDPRSRRQLLVGGGAAAVGAAALLSGCGNSTTKADTIALGKHTPGARNDVRILNRLLDLEYHAIYAYTAAIPLLAAVNRQQKAAHKASHPAPKAPAAKKKTSPPLSTIPLLASNAAAQFLSQEIDHSLELKAIIKQAGGKPGRPAPTYDIGSPSTRADILAVLRGIELSQLVAYRDAVTLLTPGQLRAAAAAIFANEAQHLMVLRMQLGLSPIPSAFVTGQE